MPRVLVAYRSVQVTPIMVAPISDLLPTIHATYISQIGIQYNFMVEKSGNLPEIWDLYSPRISIQRTYLGPESLMPTRELLLYVFLVLVHVHTQMSYQQFVAVVCATQSHEYSVGRMTYLPQATNNYVRTHNVTAKPRHEYYFLFSKRSSVLV